MPQPHFTLTISAAVVAWYAAILSTAATAVQTANFLRDRKKLKLDILRNMATDHPRRTGMTFTLLRVTNANRRPVTITLIYVERAHNEKGILNDTNPPLPCELTEGKQLAAFLDEAVRGFDTVRYFVVCDSTGREYRRKFVR